MLLVSTGSVSQAGVSYDPAELQPAFVAGNFHRSDREKAGQLSPCSGLPFVLASFAILKLVLPTRFLHCFFNTSNPNLLQERLGDINTTASKEPAPHDTSPSYSHSADSSVDTLQVQQSKFVA